METTVPRRKHRLIVTVPLALVVAGGATVTLAAFAGRWWWVFDLLANFRAHIAVLGLAVTLMCLVARRRRLFLAAAVATLVNLATITPLYIPRWQAPPGDAVILRLMHLNVWLGNQDYAAVAAAMRGSDADVIFLQEGMGDAWMAGLAGRTGPYELVARADARRETWGLTMWARQGLAQRIEVVSHAFLPRERAGIGAPVLEAVIRIDGVEVPILSLHPPPPMRERGWAERNAGLVAAGRWAAAQTRPCVVIGDFNTTPWTHGFSLATAGDALVNSQRGYGLAATWPAGIRHLGAIPIDHCLHSPSVVTLARHIGDATGSDHLPLHVTLAIPRGVQGKSR